jgi:hypothetical protein
MHPKLPGRPASMKSLRAASATRLDLRSALAIGGIPWLGLGPGRKFALPLGSPVRDKGNEVRQPILARLPESIQLGFSSNVPMNSMRFPIGVCDVRSRSRDRSLHAASVRPSAIACSAGGSPTTSAGLTPCTENPSVPTQSGSRIGLNNFLCEEQAIPKTAVFCIKTCYTSRG